MATYVSSSVDITTLVSEENIKTVKGFREKIDGIAEVLSRDHMKVVFFGRTSNGKSTVINAMLRDKILPSGIGHTTHCFIQVEGTDSKEASLRTEESDEPKSIKDIKQLASALSTVKLSQNSLIRILWPKDKCRLLREDVVLVDSPGIDVTPDLDTWIDKFCLDADVFVLVANAESTLMQTEKNFFHKVSSRLSQPNIFILQNRWDVSEMEEDIEAVKQQHIERNTEFLADELNVTDKRSAKDRVFFVSAREALASRLNCDKGIATPGNQSTSFNFKSFIERYFHVCISQSAVKTKFEQHTKRAHLINSEIRSVMEEAYTKSLTLQDEQLQLRKDKSERLNRLDKQLDSLTSEVKTKIRNVVDEVERKVSSALNDEIRRLSLLVEEFERPFHPDPMLLNIYKKELHNHIEQTLGRNLQARCSTLVIQAVDATQMNMTERLGEILPAENKQQLLNLIPKRDFEIAYRLDCRNLCAGFREDIEFRFSLSPTALMQRFLGIKGHLQDLSAAPNVVRGTVGGDNNQPIPLRGDSDLLISLLATFASLTSRSTLGAAVVVGLVAKTAGWKVIVVTGALYGGVYLYERLTWTSKARERAFKQQYVDYASSKLRLIIDLTSSNCSHQVQQSARAKTLRNKADFFDQELKGFVLQFLSHSGL
uniref:Dynamin-type G domain-containing protein n=1 Tax=Biomphalaria glabrata TaxID=6526 RepID=A0A2C9K6X0_BIOGL